MPNDRSTCILIEGDAGIGKTRLAEQFRSIAEERNWIVLWGHAEEQEANVPYWLWVKLLRTLLQEGLWFPPSEQSLDYTLFAPLLSLLPELVNFFPSVESASSANPAYTPTSRIYDALFAVFDSICADASVALFVDDLHNADTTSLELLSIFAHRITSLPIVIVGMYREQEIPLPLSTLITDLQRDHHGAILHLTRLDDEDTRVLVCSIAPLSDEQVEHIVRQAGGNPFYAEELTRSSTQRPSSTVAAALDRRLHALSPPCQELMRRACVLGESFELQVLTTLEADTHEDTLLDLLEEAMHAKILLEVGVGRAISYQFAHSLLFRHLYDHLTQTRRARLHRQVARVFQQVYAQHKDEWAAAIVYHLVAGEADPHDILHHSLVAADRAYSLSAYAEAAYHYHLALDALQGVQQQQGDFLLDRQEALWLSQATLIERLAECSAVRGEFTTAQRLYQDALRLWENEHANEYGRDTYRAHMIALLWCEIGWTWHDEGELAHALSSCIQGIHVLQGHSIEDGPALARLYFCQASCAWRAGEYTKAQTMGEKALQLFEYTLSQPLPNQYHRSRATRISRTLAGDPIDPGRVHALLGPFCSAVGQLDEALTHLHSALALFKAYNCLRESAHAYCNRADVYIQQKDYLLARSDLERARLLAEQTGDIPLQAVVIGNLGIIEKNMAHFAEAEALLLQSVRLAQQIHDMLFESMWLVYLADAYSKQQKFVDARKAVGRALLLGRSIKNASAVGHALVALGTIRVQQALASASSHLAPSTLPSLLLMRACMTLRQALLGPLENEFKERGEEVLSQAMALLHQMEFEQK